MCNCKCKPIEFQIRDLKWKWYKIHSDLTYKMYELGNITEEKYKNFY